MTTQQKYIEMPNLIALELIKTFLEPGMPTLGMWFGWNQPNKDDVVKLGSAYGYSTSEKFYWDEVFEGATFEQKKEFVKFMRKWKKNPHLPINLNATFETDEIFFPYQEMDIQHQMLYRLMVMSVNTCGTDYHEWSIEFGYKMASWYGDKKSATKEWKVARIESNHERFVEEFVDTFGDLVNLDIRIDEDDHYPEGIVEKHVNPDTLQWLEDFIENHNSDANTFYKWLFDVEVNQYTYCTYWHDEVNQVVAWFIDWMKDEWLSGNLTLTPDSPNEKLNQWLKLVESMPTLPGFMEEV